MTLSELVRAGDVPGLKSKGVLAFSAHYKVDAEEGVLYNFGLAAPPATAISLFALSASGQVLRQGSFALPAGEQQLVHDCAMSSRYLCFVVDPWSIASTGQWLQALLGTTSFGGSFKWDADKKTRVVVVRKVRPQRRSWREREREGLATPPPIDFPSSSSAPYTRAILRSGAVNAVASPTSRRQRCMSNPSLSAELRGQLRVLFPPGGPERGV